MRLCAKGSVIALYFLLVGSAVASNKDERYSLNFKDITNPEVRASAIETFNDGLHNIDPNANVETCDMLIYAHPGTVETIYSAICSLKSSHTVVICGDTGVGEFGLAESFSATKKYLAEFARNICPGG